MDKRPVMATRGVALFLLISCSVAGIVDGQPSLSTSYYSKTCPGVTSTVDQVVLQAIKQSRNIVGGLLRLHFHDCFIRGCDASVLIDSTPTHLAEKDGTGNANSLRGFEVIDNVKSALERACPGIVSCADILGLVALSAVSQIGGPSWSLPLGRRDGNASNAAETSSNLPSLDAPYLVLKNVFASKGLNEQDLVALSGAHTIGNTHCHTIEPRLYNSTGAGGVDPTLNSTYATQLKAACPFSNGRSTTIVPMDPTLGGDTFDSNYFTNVNDNRGLFTSDATLITDPNGLKLVLKDSSGPQLPFFSDFAQAMTKMASISVVLAPEGDVRQNCHFFNSPAPAAAPASIPTASAPTPVPSRGPIPTPTPVSSPGPIATPPPAALAPTTTAPVPAATPPTPAPVPASPPPPPPPPPPAPAPVPASPPPPPPPPPPAPAPVPVATSPASVGVPSDATSRTPAPPVPTSPATTPVTASPVPATTPVSASPVPATTPVSGSPVPATAPVSASPVPAPIAPVVKSPPPSRISSSTRSPPSALKSTAPPLAAKAPSSSSRNRSPSPIFYIVVKAAEVFIRTLRW